MAGLKTPFGFHTTAGEVVSGVDLTGKRAIVTGGASGIGTETVRALARAGASITIGARNPEVAENVAAELRASTDNAAIHVKRLDLSDPSSVRSFAEDWHGPLNILVNNAGIMALPERVENAHGWEMQFATNFLGHFALTVQLRAALAAAGGARVVSVSSSGNLLAPVIFDDLHFNFMAYDPFVAYGQSKTACALLAVGISRRWSDDGIVSNSLNPGAIATNLQRHTGGLRTPPERQKTPEQGAATSVLLAASPLLDGVGGLYFEDCNEAPVVGKRPSDFRGVAPYALDPENADRLWWKAERLLGMGE